MATEDKLVTNTFLQEEIDERKLRDQYIAAYTGQPLSSGEPSNVTPDYSVPATATGDVADGLTLTQAVDALAVNKNSRIIVYEEDGTTSQGNNPRGIYLTKDSESPTSLTLAAEKIILNLSQTSTEEFVTDVTPSYGSFGVIGASVTFVRNLVVTKKKVTIL